MLEGTLGKHYQTSYTLEAIVEFIKGDIVSSAYVIGSVQVA
jgi:hypothetical protein